MLQDKQRPMAVAALDSADAEADAEAPRLLADACMTFRDDRHRHWAVRFESQPAADAFYAQVRP